MNYKTVDQIVVELGLEPEPRLTWGAGNAAAATWRRRYGCDPRREMRPKTDPFASVPAEHMKCVYPDFFHAVIIEIILELNPETARQEDFFGHD